MTGCQPTIDVPVADCDVLVIGGGPAGATISALLAKRGRSVVLIEKDQHPRFHIGESLLPMNMPLFQELGVADEVADIGMRKNGIDFFNSEKGETRRTTIYFDEAMDNSFPHAYQVRRSDFDRLLLNNAQRCGVEVRQQTRVTSLDRLQADGCQARITDAEGREGTVTARFLIDASGRDTFLSRRFKQLRRNPDHNAAAIFGHFRDVPRRDGRDEGNIGLHWFEHGWFWVIPLKDGITSVGTVCWPEYLKTRGDISLDDFLQQTIARSPTLTPLMESAEPVAKAQGTGNYSYWSDRLYGDGYLLVGDAFAFIDPVFSSGVFLAMKSAQSGAEAVDAILDGAPNANALLARHERFLRRGIRTVSWFIYRYNSPTLRRLFMNPGNQFGIKSAIISVLAGDTFGRTPIGIRVFIFKLIYTMLNLSNWRGSLAFVSRRRRNNRMTIST
ncbi:MAG: tryptophan 7-halogenase [Proteobacteria bacterium]|nr:tryptophan 7-halogenase [Pseudomonadota bacterium]